MKNELMDLSKFKASNLPELQGKKEEIKSIIDANPIVEIIDNTTYELAKKSRTAVKTLRTSLQNEQKDVKKKIKELVLDVVDAEYETLVSDVKLQEKERQDPVTIWEEKKEEEKREKARLEELRIKQSKEAIKTFKDAWLGNVDRLLINGVDRFLGLLEETITKMDKSKFQEFEILFDDAVVDIKAKFISKRDLLISQEEIRLERERLAKIEAEQNRVNKIKSDIDNWEKNWLFIINNLEFKNISVPQREIEEQKALDCQEFQPEYAEKRKQIQELLSAKVSQLKEAEEQRIEREKFLQEKADFEAKQAESKYQERKKFVVDEGYWDIYLAAECFDRESTARLNLLAFSDLEFEDFKLAVLKSKELVSVIKEEPIKADVDSKSEEIHSESKLTESFSGNEQIQDFEENVIHEVEFEETWESIFQDYLNDTFTDECSSTEFFVDWLHNHYNVPTKK